MYHIIHCIINSILYVFICLMIIRRKKYTSISIRSPYLLIFNNIFTFLISIFLIFIENDIFKHLICECQILMIISFFLIYRRISICCEIKNEEKNDIEKFYLNQNLYDERYYVKILFFCFLSFSVVQFIIFLIEKYSQISIFKYYWTGLLFIEILILITNSFKILNEELLQFQIFLLIVIWLICLNFKIEISNKDKTYFFIIIYISTFFSSILPILMTYFFKNNITFRFNPKLMDDLYLFLLDKECYNFFSNYMRINHFNNLIYLTIYIHIIKFKFEFDLIENQFIINNEARNIYHLYFENNDFQEKFSKEIFENIRKKMNDLNNNNPEKNLFDDILKYCFIELGKIFQEFRKTYEYHLLNDSIYFSSYIHCKMSNIGMINKY